MPTLFFARIPPYLALLLYWFNELTYAALLTRYNDHLLRLVARQLNFTPLEYACAAYHHSEGPGAAPTHPVPRLVRALLVAYLFDWSLRDLEFHIQCNLLVKWFVGYAVYESAPDHSTLNRFEQWVITHQHRTFFDETLKQIDALFPQECTQPQVGDSFGLQANAAKESLGALLRHTCRRLLDLLQQAAPETAARLQATSAHADLFGATGECSAALQTTVRAAHEYANTVRTQLEGLSLTASTRQCVHIWLERLDKILADEVHITPATETSPATITILPESERGSYRLGSATDPDATYRTHGQAQATLGYNIQIAVSENFVREIQACPCAGHFAHPNLFSRDFATHAARR